MRIIVLVKMITRIRITDDDDNAYTKVELSDHDHNDDR